MNLLTNSQISSLLGMPRSTLCRNLKRFPSARVGRGLYSTEDAPFAAWLAARQLCAAQKPERPKYPRSGTDPLPRSVGDSYKHLPSGVLIETRQWDSLRGEDETQALVELDVVIREWHLSPHPSVPDLLPWHGMDTPGGFVVNANQWEVFRSADSSGAAHALDCLIRRFPDQAGTLHGIDRDSPAPPLKTEGRG